MTAGRARRIAKSARQARGLLALEILVTYARVRWTLRGRDIATVVAQLRARPRATAAGASATRLGRRLDGPVRRTLAATPWDSRCLMRSLVLLAMLERRGASCALVIGATPGEAFGAHAWLEHDGRAITETLGFAPLTTL